MSGPPKRKCHKSGFLSTSSHGPTPGTGASMITKDVTRSGCWAANAKPTMFPMSCVTRSTRSIASASSTPATSPAWVFLS